jgi:hypothetical protein
MKATSGRSPTVTESEREQPVVKIAATIPTVIPKRKIQVRMVVASERDCL